MATSVGEGAWDPKVPGSNPRRVQWITTTIIKAGSTAMEGQYVKGLNLTPLFYNEKTNVIKLPARHLRLNEVATICGDDLMRLPTKWNSRPIG